MNTHKGMIMQTENGNIAHVLADPNMSKETEQAIAKMIDLAYEKIKKTEVSHRNLVESAYKWVIRNSSCGVAFKELVTTACNGECPDVIGFGSWGHSVLVECKASRSDFHADKKKIFRQIPSMGMGTQRFYCCPTGLLKKEDLPDGWGLIYVNEKLKATCVHSPYKGNISERHNGFEKNIKAEHGLMYSALRRLHLRGRIDEIYDYPEKVA